MARVLGQQRKAMRLAEKCRQVGGQRIDKRLPLGAVGVRFQRAKITPKILQPERTQPPHQPVVNHIPLVARQHDAGTLVDQLADASKVRVCQHKTVAHLLEQ